MWSGFILPVVVVVSMVVVVLMTVRCMTCTISRVVMVVIVIVLKMVMLRRYSGKSFGLLEGLRFLIRQDMVGAMTVLSMIMMLGI